MRKAALERDLDRREADELARVDAITEHMRRMLTEALATGTLSSCASTSSTSRSSISSTSTARPGAPGSTVSTTNGERERAAVERRYRGVRELTFPVAVVLLTRAETR